MTTAIITGASRGIGRATAQLFLQNGHRVYACARDLDTLIALKAEYPNTCHPVFLDFGSPDSLNALRDRVAKDGVTINYLIHNAGHLVNKPFLEIQFEELLACYRVNVLGPFQLTQQLFSLLSPNSHTVFISSMGGFQGSVKFPGLTAYSSSKAAEASLAESLQAEFAGYSHSFNSLCLGAVQTEMLQNAFPGYDAPLKSTDMAAFIYQFTTSVSQFVRGKVVPVSLSTP